MDIFSWKSNSDTCASCGENTSLSKYGCMPVTDSRVFAEDDIDPNNRSGQTFYTRQGEAVTPGMAYKMGPWYFYWTDFDISNPQFNNLCSRKCAIRYSKTKNMILFLHIDSGGDMQKDEPIKPHQEEIDRYRYDHNIEGNKWTISE